MLIHFDLSDSELNLIETNTLEMHLSVLLRAHRSGKHLVVLSRRSIEAITKMKLKFIASDEAIFKRLSQNVTQNGLLHAQAKKYISITVHGKIFQSGTKVLLPLDHSNFLQIIEPPVLILEDVINDGKIIKTILKSSPAKLNCNFFCFDEIHGGGSRTEDIALQWIDKHRIVLVIKDSDKKTPFCGIKSDCNLNSALQKWPLSTLLIWPCHEIENVFTLQVLQELKNKDNESCLSHLTRMDRLDSDNNVEESVKYQYFFDVKNGISTASLQKITNQTSKKWLLEHLKAANIAAEDFDIPGFGKNVSEQILKNDKALSAFHRVVRSEKWSSVFGSFISDLFWIIFASPIQRT